jgi:hypothetical protein
MRVMSSTKMKLNLAPEMGNNPIDGQGEHEAIPKSPSLEVKKTPNMVK